LPSIDYKNISIKKIANDKTAIRISSELCSYAAKQGFCKIRATEYRLKYIGNSNRLLYLGRSNKKVTAKQAAVILIPVLRKAPNVGVMLKRQQNPP
jgi:hypothetical protein